MKVVTTVKNGCAAQSNSIQPQMPRRGEVFGSVSVKLSSSPVAGDHVPARSLISPAATDRRETVISPPSVSACSRSRVAAMRSPPAASQAATGSPPCREARQRRDRDAAPRRADRVDCARDSASPS